MLIRSYRDGPATDSILLGHRDEEYVPRPYQLVLENASCLDQGSTDRISRTSGRSLKSDHSADSWTLDYRDPANAIACWYPCLRRKVQIRRLLRRHRMGLELGQMIFDWSAASGKVMKLRSFRYAAIYFLKQLDVVSGMAQCPLNTQDSVTPRSESREGSMMPMRLKPSFPRGFR